jgi:glutathione S-transferase
MTDLLRLHYAPDNASLCVRLALEMLGLPYEVRLLDRSKGEQSSAAYLAINPNGLIPTLETPDGALFETAAILLWLSEREGKLFPAPGSAQRGEGLKWLFWLANELHASERVLFYSERLVSADHVGELDRSVHAQIRQHFHLLDNAAPAWLAEDTILGCYLAPLLRWPVIYGNNPGWLSLADYPNLLAFARRFEATEASRRCAEAEGLGEKPFSAPEFPNPPEGSPL